MIDESMLRRAYIALYHSTTFHAIAESWKDAHRIHALPGPALLDSAYSELCEPQLPPPLRAIEADPAAIPAAVRAADYVADAAAAVMPAPASPSDPLLDVAPGPSASSPLSLQGSAPAAPSGVAEPWTPQRWLVSSMVAGFTSLLHPHDTETVCPHPDCGNNPSTLMCDCTCLGSVARLGGLMADDLRDRLTACPHRGALPPELRFISGAAGMRVFSKLLYRFVRPPPLPGTSAPPATSESDGPLALSEMEEAVVFLQQARGASAVVAKRMRALASVFVYLRDHVPETRVGSFFRCPVAWAHFLYPVCMPSTLWVSFEPVEQACVLRALKQENALEPTPHGRALAGRVQRIAPWIRDYLSACKVLNFPEVRQIAGGGGGGESLYSSWFSSLTGHARPCRLHLRYG